MERKRSRGITITSWFGIISGLLTLMYLFFYSLSSYKTLRLIPLFITSIFFILAGVLTLKLKTSGRILMLALNGYIFLNCFIKLLIIRTDIKPYLYNLFDIVTLITGIVISAILIYFFTRQKIKEQFR